MVLGALGVTLVPCPLPPVPVLAQPKTLPASLSTSAPDPKSKGIGKPRPSQDAPWVDLWEKGGCPICFSLSTLLGRGSQASWALGTQGLSGIPTEAHPRSEPSPVPPRVHTQLPRGLQELLCRKISTKRRHLPRAVALERAHGRPRCGASFLAPSEPAPLPQTPVCLKDAPNPGTRTVSSSISH